MLESARSSVDTYISSIDKPIEGNNNDCNNHNNNNYCYANRNECTDGLANGESDAGGSVDSEHHQEEKQTRSESKRTMNAFLMFCKKHRALVRQHFASKENRFITKILGSWWGQLDAAKKKPYEMLAQEYRTNVKAANPNRWSEQQEKTEIAPSALVGDDYVQTKGFVKLWSSVVTKQEVPDDIKGVVGLRSSILAKQEVPGDIKEDMVSREAAESLVQLSQGTPLRTSSISMGKLANVNEMGSLSELCNGTRGAGVESVGPSFRATNVAEHNYSARQNTDEGALIKQPDTEPSQPMEQHFAAESRPTMGTPVNGFAVPVATEPTDCDGQGSNVAQGASGRATRSCKAKRYKEFMTNPYGGTALASSTRKSSKKRTSATVPSGSLNKHNGHAYCATSKTFYKTAQHVTATATVPVVSAAAAPVDVEALRRDVHHKIAKLPCEDFQAFLASKNMEKRRKKPYAVSARARRNKAKAVSSSLPSSTVTGSSSNSNSSNTPFQHATSLPILPSALVVESPPVMVVAVITEPQNTMPSAVPTPQQPAVAIRPTVGTSTKIVGCRKRKAPKENITRNPEPTVLERQTENEPVPRPAYVWPEMGHVTSS